MQNSSVPNKTSTYLLYAVGEIILVMIGILLALQVNNWNSTQKDREMEKRFLSELILDMQSDSLALANFKQRSDEQVQSKRLLTKYYNGRITPEDSLILYFEDQWKTHYYFNPITTTLDEMKSTGNLRVIGNPQLRRSILETYNYYEDFMSMHLKIYNRQQQESWNLYFSSIPDLYATEPGESSGYNIEEALKDFELQNRLMGNYANGMNRALQEIIEVNAKMLLELRTEFKNKL